MREGIQCGCYESELCLRMIKGVILLKKFLKRKQMEQNMDKHT
jgi:hypothetical protein